MKKIIITISFIILIITPSISQCNLKTTVRPDGNVIKYFNPQPVIRQSEYEVGISIYKNITTDELMLNISVLFKSMVPKKLTKNAIIQTTNIKGIDLVPLMSETIVMNGRDVSMGLYKIGKVDFEELKKYPLKSVFFYLEGHLKGSTVTENKFVLKDELNCF
ncbi:hypothetical protein [Lutibacter sp.]|uniref:hypothetical protein n=1 Tax=Lutibacter sp. TaxID=1925666 RepID=UPI002737213F|nr:hypothetical protein [Lutibacter sp.]MDP3314388.1 hypothetical protein [Lutibacter sp.]